MKKLERITFDPAVMRGRPCIRGLRVTVGTLVGLLAAGSRARTFCGSIHTLSPQTSTRRSLTLPGIRGKPSCLSTNDITPKTQLENLLAALRRFAGPLADGALISLDVARARVRVLPVK